MGKSQTVSIRKTQRRDPLHAQIRNDTDVSFSTRPPRSKRNGQSVAEPTYVDSKTSKKILSLARQQQDELASEGGIKVSVRPHVFGSKSAEVESDEEDTQSRFDEDEEDWAGVDEGVLEIDEDDKALLEQFFPSQPVQRQNLADIITAKLNEYESQGDVTKNSETGDVGDRGATSDVALHAKVVEVFSKVGTLLGRYKSGKLPKAFKRISTLANWEQVLYITRPDQWSDQAMYEATRIFVSSFNPRDAQRFLNQVLLERFRDEVANTKKINYHIFHAIKKSFYKPSAFYKGFLLPLCQSGTCTLREAAIVAAALTRVSVPVLHSSAALLKLAEMDYTGANSIFIRTLLDKKYALPYKVVDALVAHFIRFKYDQRQLPVLFHQSMLVFVQRYKEDITPEQKDALLDLLRAKGHSEIAQEIRREIVNSKCRGDMKMGAAMEIVDVQMVNA